MGIALGALLEVEAVERVGVPVGGLFGGDGAKWEGVWGARVRLGGLLYSSGGQSISTWSKAAS